MRIGVLGGTFDPPHLGHLLLAEQAHEQLRLDKTLWIPAADPPHKQNLAITHVEHRLAMLRLAIEGNNHFAVSLADVNRPGPHFTADLLDILHGEYPTSELFFLIGGDSLRDLATWHQPQRIIDTAKIAVMTRPDAEYDLDMLEAALPGLRERLHFVESPLIEIAGSTIRQQVRAGQSIRYLVPDAVNSYIRDHQLYHPE